MIQTCTIWKAGYSGLRTPAALSKSVEDTARLLSYRVAGAVLAARMQNSLKGHWTISS